MGKHQGWFLPSASVKRLGLVRGPWFVIRKDVERMRFDHVRHGCDTAYNTAMNSVCTIFHFITDNPWRAQEGGGDFKTAPRSLSRQVAKKAGDTTLFRKAARRAPGQFRWCMMPMPSCNVRAGSYIIFHQSTITCLHGTYWWPIAHCLHPVSGKYSSGGCSPYAD